MSETFLNKAQLTGLSKDARRTEILRAKETAALADRVATNETDIAGQTGRMACMVSRSTFQSIPNATATAVNWDAEQFDTHGMHDNAVNNDRLTVPTGGAGLWTMGFTISYDFQATGTIRSGVVWRNGTGAAFLALVEQPPVAYSCLHGSGIYRLNDGDYLTCRVYHDSGAAMNIRGNATVGNISNFWAYRLGD